MKIWPFFRSKHARNLVIIAMTIAAGLLISDFKKNHITTSETSSVAGANFFYYTRNFQKKELVDNATVMFPLNVPKEIRPNCNPCILLKRIKCDEGSKLVSKDSIFYCNNQYLGFAKTKSKTGIPVKHFEYNGIVPSGKSFVMGDHPDSYDSRYWGFVDKEKVYAIAYPIVF